MKQKANWLARVIALLLMLAKKHRKKGTCETIYRLTVDLPEQNRKKSAPALKEASRQIAGILKKSKYPFVAYHSREAKKRAKQENSLCFFLTMIDEAAMSALSDQIRETLPAATVTYIAEPRTAQVEKL